MFRASEQGQAEILQAALHLHGSTACAAQSTLTDAHPPSTPSSALQLPCIHPYQPTADVEITILFLEFRCPAAATALYHDRTTARAAPNAPWLIPTMNDRGSYSSHMSPSHQVTTGTHCELPPPRNYFGR